MGWIVLLTVVGGGGTSLALYSSGNSHAAKIGLIVTGVLLLIELLVWIGGDLADLVGDIFDIFT